MDLPAGLFAGGTEGFEEATPVDVVAKGGFAVVAAAHEMVDRAGVLASRGGGHGNDLISPGPHCQLLEPTPSFDPFATPSPMVSSSFPVKYAGR